jgi:hypothetical protein
VLYGKIYEKSRQHRHRRSRARSNCPKPLGFFAYFWESETHFIISSVKAKKLSKAKQDEYNANPKKSLKEHFFPLRFDAEGNRIIHISNKDMPRSFANQILLKDIIQNIENIAVKNIKQS